MRRRRVEPASLAGLVNAATGSGYWPPAGYARGGRLIRARKRTLRYPLGRPLLCAYPTCTFKARSGYDVRVGDTLWPHCSQQHARAWNPIKETR